MRDLAENFETSDLIRHCSLSSATQVRPGALIQAARARSKRERRIRIARLNDGWELRRYPQNMGRAMAQETVSSCQDEANAATISSKRGPHRTKGGQCSDLSPPTCQPNEGTDRFPLQLLR